MTNQTTVESAIPTFARYACAGDSVEWQKAGLILNARLEYDGLTTPSDFWTPDSDEIEGKRLCDTWLNDEWYYIGLVISVSAIVGDGNKVCLDQYAASIWGIEYHHSAERANLSQLVETLETEALTQAEMILNGLVQFVEPKRPESSSAMSRWAVRLKQRFGWKSKSNRVTIH